MGSNFQADIPDNEHLVVWDSASAATNGASTITVLFEAPQAIVVTECAWIPTGGNQSGHATSYRKISLIDGSTDGSGTVEIGSYGFTASAASNTPADMTVATANASVGDGDVVIFSQTTVGGTKDSETELKAGQIMVRYRVR